MSEKKEIKKRFSKVSIGVIVTLIALLIITNAWQYMNFSNDKNNLQNQLDSLTTERNQLQGWLDGNISALTFQINALTEQKADLSSIVNLQKSAIWVYHETVSQPANNYTSWARTASYAGYVSVYVESSTTSNTYASVEYISHGVNYDVTITVGTSGTAVFPVLPATITIYVGNTNLFVGATETVTITYYY